MTMLLDVEAAAAAAGMDKSMAVRHWDRAMTAVVVSR